MQDVCDSGHCIRAIWTRRGCWRRGARACSRRRSCAARRAATDIIRNSRGSRPQPDPRGAIAAYLRGLYAEACARGYRFDAENIAADDFAGRLDCTRGQLLYEWQHLRAKLRERDARKFAEVQVLAAPEAHPLFNIVAGGVEAWEVTNET
ncbi:MAG TPA: hypothetical protein VE775_05125 [Pyrinomonadaceae bacterium]|nr:hypothetical protein [Pyrinomonadaceae bacterium]